MEGLKLVAGFITTIGLGTLAPLLVTAVTSWINRDTAKKQLEIEKLRHEKPML